MNFDFDLLMIQKKIQIYIGSKDDLNGKGSFVLQK